MSNQITTQTTSVSKLFQQNNVQKRFEQLLGKKAQGFITSVMQVVNSSKLLATADPQTILTAAATAAILDLPINQNLGHAYIVPYKGQAQFQIGWKGFVQLAQRTGQFDKINTIEVYENQFRGFNQLTEELDADFSTDGKGEIVGYVAYFRLINGFNKTSYWTKDKVIQHAKKYSQAYGKGGFSPWNDKDQFHEMAKKTVLKNLLNKYAPLSIEMQTAQLADQSIQKEEGEFMYLDNEFESTNFEVVADKKEELKAKQQNKADKKAEESQPKDGLFNAQEMP
jgi:recombination protein RecT